MATPPLPPGFTLDGPSTPPPPPGFTLDQQSTAPEAAAPEPPRSISDRLKGFAQDIGNVATSVTGGLAGDVAGLGALAYDITGTALTGREPGTFADPAAVRERVSSALTYTPPQQGLTGKILTYPGRVVGEAGESLNDIVTRATGNTYAGRVAGGIPLAVASALGVKAGVGPTMRTPQGRVPIPERVPGTPPPPVEVTPQQQALKNARDAGYKVDPARANAPVGKATASAAGRPQLERELSRSNATITDSLAAKHLGLDTKKPFSRNDLDKARAEANKPYAEIAATGKRVTSDDYRADIAKIADRTGADSFAEDTPAGVQRLKEIYGGKREFDARDAVSRIKQLRREARDNQRRDRTPEQKAVGHAQRAVADALDAELARHVSDKGLGDLAKRYEAARVQLAKINTVEEAIQGNNVSARRLSQMQKRGVPLSGELKLIADTFDSFDTVMQDLSKIRDHGPLSAVDYLVGVGGAATDPTLAAAVLARPAARAVLASEAYQRRLTPRVQKPEPRRGNSSRVAPATVPAVQQRERASR